MLKLKLRLAKLNIKGDLWRETIIIRVTLRLSCFLFCRACNCTMLRGIQRTCFLVEKCHFCDHFSYSASQFLTAARPLMACYFLSLFCRDQPWCTQAKIGWWVGGWWVVVGWWVAALFTPPEDNGFSLVWPYKTTSSDSSTNLPIVKLQS